MYAYHMLGLNQNPVRFPALWGQKTAENVFAWGRYANSDARNSIVRCRAVAEAPES